MRNYLLADGDSLIFDGAKIVHRDGKTAVGEYLRALGAEAGDVVCIVEKSTFDEVMHNANAGAYFRNALRALMVADEIHAERVARQKEGAE